MSELEQIAKNMIVDDKAMGDLFYYFERWQDEREYEDWQDYADAIEKKFACPGVSIKANRRPFGFTMLGFKEKIKIGIKVKGRKYLVTAEFV